MGAFLPSNVCHFDESAYLTRIICTSLKWEAWNRTVSSINIYRGFTEIRYTWKDKSIVSPRSLLGFAYDLTEESSLASNREGDGNTQNRIVNDRNVVAHQRHIQSIR